MERTHGLFEPSLPATAEDRAKDQARWVVSELLHWKSGVGAAVSESEKQPSLMKNTKN